jgi:hypothetical protein
MKKSSDFDHEKINLVEKNVGTPAILGTGSVILLGLKNYLKPCDFYKVCVSV